MTDESGKMPKFWQSVDKLTPRYQYVKAQDIGNELCQRSNISLPTTKTRKGKWVSRHWEGIESAHQEILDSIKRYQEKKAVVNFDRWITRRANPPTFKLPKFKPVPIPKGRQTATDRHSPAHESASHVTRILIVGV